MILRKPYAFFIKYFRLINLVMAILMGILIYRTWMIASFLNRYVNDYITASNNFVIGSYINIYSFLIPLFIVIFTIIVLSVLFVKQKPKKLYVINLVIYILLIVLYGVDYFILHGINEVIWSIQISKAVRDITYIFLVAQVVSCILTLIRATGFDIKQFNFGTDLQQLDIDTKDNEEFEVAVEFDKNKINRNIRKTIRGIWYSYVEHKFIVNLTMIIVVIILIFTLFMGKTVYRADYKESATFQASGVALNIKHSYITQNDKNGKLMMRENGKLSENRALLIIKFDVRSLYSDEDAILNTGLINLHIGDTSFNQTPNYNSQIDDIGTPYIGQNLSKEFTSYVLAFDIPKKLVNNRMELKFNDQVSYIKGEMGAKNIYVTLKPKDLTKEHETKNDQLKEITSFSGSILENAELQIESVEVANKFKTSYNFCFNKNKCYESFEYLTPTATGSYFKTLMKINGEFEEDTAANIENVDNLYYFLNKYGWIHYKIGDTWYFHKIDSKLIKPQNGKTDAYYIEVNKDIEKATSIYFTFNVRNYSYKYTIK